VLKSCHLSVDESSGSVRHVVLGDMLSLTSVKLLYSSCACEMLNEILPAYFSATRLLEIVEKYDVCALVAAGEGQLTAIAREVEPVNAIRFKVRQLNGLAAL
jgi:hypothetical protein